MIKVEQTIYNPPYGNCLPACIASVFEVPLEEVPHLGEDEAEDWNESSDGWNRYWKRLHAEFLHPLGFYVIELDIKECKGYKPEGYSILTAQSPRGEWLHAVVAKEGKIAWDPHPQRDLGVGEWRFWSIFAAYDPARAASR